MLENKVVMITGASSGIGWASAKAFSEAGAKCILSARREERLQQLRSELATNSLVLPCDITDKTSIQMLLSSLPAEWQDIDILINNAGLSSTFGSFQQHTDDDIDQMIDTNVKGLLLITQRVVNKMIERNHGHIINLGSIAGHESYPNGSVYCASKAAVRAFSRALKMDLLGTQIRVSSIDPGMVETEFSEVRFDGDKERAKKVYNGMTPLSAKDIADTILYVATRPKHVNISEVLLMPTNQASATMVHRS